MSIVAETVVENNPLLAQGSLPRFEEITPDHVLPALEQLLGQQRQQLQWLLARNRFDWASLMVPLAEMDEGLSRVWGPVTHLNAVCDSEALREVYQQGMQLMTAWEAELSQNCRLFEAVKSLHDAPSFQDLSMAQQQAVDHALRDFRLSGAALDEPAKVRMTEIRMRLSELSTTFEQHLLDATRAFTLHLEDANALTGLPPAIREAAQQRAEQERQSGWLFTLDIPSYLPFMQYGACRSLREQLYHAYVTRASSGALDNAPLIDEILCLRRELAALIGLDHYADYSLASKMAPSVDAVRDFLLDLAGRARPAAEQEWAQLQQFACEELGIDQLEAWDIPFASERLRQQRYQIDQQQLRPWFPQKKVLQGLFAVAEKLYGVRIQSAKAPLWHQDVQFFEVLNVEGTPIAAFWLDPYARAHKRGGAWMDECLARWRREPEGALQLPVAYLVCNFDQPVGDQPALWTHDEVVTLFHEFGHGLHHMLTEIDVRPVSGINGVPWDAVELPSQFMEQFCWQQESLALISGHVTDGAPLPEDARTRLLAARNFHSGLQTLRQVEFALFDIELHAGFDPSGAVTVAQLLEQVRARVAVIQPPRFNRFECGFSHIFAGGYAAGYYSYKWAELLSSDVFAAFEEEGVFNRDTAQRFRTCLLSVGGSRDMMAAFVDFRGREPTPDALLRHSGLLTA
ncbi:MAG: M3 family metallopeptidase [Mariprofundales bacterium]